MLVILQSSNFWTVSSEHCTAGDERDRVSKTISERRQSGLMSERARANRLDGSHWTDAPATTVTMTTRCVQCQFQVNGKVTFKCPQN